MWCRLFCFNIFPANEACGDVDASSDHDVSMTVNNEEDAYGDSSDVSMDVNSADQELL